MHIWNLFTFTPYPESIDQVFGMDEGVRRMSNMLIARLKDLGFVDLYVRIDALAPARYRPVIREGMPNVNRPVPPEFNLEISKLVSGLRAAGETPDSSYEFDGMRFRVAKQKLANGQMWASLRRIATRIPTLEQLNFAPHIIQHLRQLGTRDGLIAISGATGHGKTTTAFALLNDYLQRMGGTAITIEDPVEYALEGSVGENGYCYQVQVDNDSEWAGALKNSLRWAPRFIMVGEIRTPRAAEQVLRAATTGHLVITTVHAGSTEEGLMGILHLAEQAMGSGGAQHMMAAGLTASLHQTLGPVGPYLRYVFTEPANLGDPVRALIRENRVGMINTYIDKQAARLSAVQGGVRK
jgi:twitching motility protein PilT